MTEEGQGQSTDGIAISVYLPLALCHPRVACDKGRIIGQKRPLLPRHLVQQGPRQDGRGFALADAVQHGRPQIPTRQYARIVRGWVHVGQSETEFLWRASDVPDQGGQINTKTVSLRAVRPLLGRKKMDSAVRDLGVDSVDTRSWSKGIDPQMAADQPRFVPVGTRRSSACTELLPSSVFLLFLLSQGVRKFPFRLHSFRHCGAAGTAR